MIDMFHNKKRMRNNADGTIFSLLVIVNIINAIVVLSI